MEHAFSNDLGRLIILLYRARRRYLGEHLREYHITGPMHIILMGVRHYPGSSQEFLSDHFYIDKATVARCARRLEVLSYLKREVLPEDRRLYRLYLTPSGENVVRIIQGYSEAWSRQLSAGFSDEERSTALSLLARMTTNYSESCPL